MTELCGLVTWAPNHKKTWPWRFALFTGDGRARLGATMVDDMIAARSATRASWPRPPRSTPAPRAVLVVAAAAHDNDMLDAENRDAVAAGIQNLLLGATTLGLASLLVDARRSRSPRPCSTCADSTRPTDSSG